MRIPAPKIDEIYAAMDILDIVGDYLPLKKKGRNYWARSPWKNERTPSFSVSADKGIYKDFSTGKGGNAVNFLMEMEGYAYAEALRHIAKRYGIEVPEEDEGESDEARARRDTRESLYITNEWAGKWFNHNLLEEPEGTQIGLSYFRERGILETTIKEFSLGYSPDTWESLTTEAARQQINPEFLTTLGLASRSETTGRLTDRFRGRVMFPIHTLTGKIAGFGGRILSSEAQMAKYINSPESPIYNKSEILYGLYQARQHIRTKDLCILTEGYMDVLRLHQNDIRHAVASSGTALTVEQVRLMKRFTHNVLLIYDGDDAGVKAALRGIDVLLAEGLDVRVLVLPDNHDPDSYVKQFGPAAFLELVEKSAASFVDFKLDVLRRQGNPNDPRRQAEIIHAVSESLARLTDRINRQVWTRYAAEKLGVEEELLYHATGEARKTVEREHARDELRKPKEAEVVPLQQAPQSNPQELELLRILMNHYGQTMVFKNVGDDEDSPPAPTLPLMEFFVNELQDLAFENQVFEGIKADVFAAHSQGQPLNIHTFLNHTDGAVSSLVADLLAERYTLSPNWKRHDAYVTALDEDLRHSAEAAVNHYKYRKILTLVNQALAHLREAEMADSDQSDQLLEVYQYLLEQRREIEATIGISGATGMRLSH